MMSKQELTLGEKETIQKSKEPTVIATANGKAESTEEATVHVNDLGRFTAVLSLGLSCEEMWYSSERDSIIGLKI